MRLDNLFEIHEEYGLELHALDVPDIEDSDIAIVAHDLSILARCRLYISLLQASSDSLRKRFHPGLIADKDGNRGYRTHDRLDFQHTLCKPGSGIIETV